MLVDDPNVLGLLSRPDEVRGHLGGDRKEDLGHDDELLPGQRQLLDRVSEYDFRKTVRVSLYVSKKLFISQVPMIRNVRWRCRRS